MSKKPDSKLNSASAVAGTDVTGCEGKDPSMDKPAKAASTSKTTEATVLKEAEMPKPAFNTKRTAELVGDGANSVGGTSGAVMKAARMIHFSGSADDIGTDKSATIKATKVSRSGDRPGKLLDTALQHIDDAPAESYSVAITTIPNLKDGNAPIGYNGVYRNAHAISQKGSGGSPADSDFFRTLDLCEYDNLYFGPGQINYIDEADRTLTVAGGKTFKLGNYMANNLKVTFTKADNQSDATVVLQFDSKDYANKVTETQYRVAGDYLRRYLNMSELDHLAMIEKSGDESKEGWSPLAKVIQNATDTNRFISEFDASVGDIIAVSVAKLNHAYAWQNNKAAKDGIRKVSPMWEMANNNVPYLDETHDTGNFRFASRNNETVGKLFTKEDKDNNCRHLSNGSAALFIAIKDSTLKYNTKGKMLSLPLSFKTALSVARQNIGAMRCHTQFLNEFHRQEVFGKVDGDASGMTPFFLSDGAKVMTPIDIFGTDCDHSSMVDPILKVTYMDLRSEYTEPIYNYFIAGLSRWFERHADRIMNVCYTEQKTGYKLTTLNIPLTSTTDGFSLWDLIVCDAMKDIAIERRKAYNLLIEYEQAHGYPYSGIENLSFESILAFPNIGFSDISSPLRSSPIPLQVGVRILLPEVFTPLFGKDGDAGASESNATHLNIGKVLLPWYFNQDSFNSVADGKGYKWEDNPYDMSHMTFFDYRGGITLGNADRIAAMDPEQLKLCMDRMITIPAASKQNTNVAVTTDVYKFSRHEDGIPLVNYSVYWETGASAEDKKNIVVIKDIICTPRELGLSMIAPAGVVTPTKSDGGHARYRNIESDSYFYTSGQSFRYKKWFVLDAPDTLFTANKSNTIAINLQAKYNTIYCTTSDVNSTNANMGIRLTSDHEGTSEYNEEIQPIVSVTPGNGNYNSETGYYNNGETPVSRTGDWASAYLYSALKVIWTRMHLIPFIINPFDAVTSDVSTIDTGVGNTQWQVLAATDPYDYLHMFNMCGFRDGEYSGLEYDRNKARNELGLNYVSDPYIERRS